MEQTELFRYDLEIEKIQLTLSDNSSEYQGVDCSEPGKAHAIAHEFMKDQGLDPDIEHFGSIFLNGKNKSNGIKEISRGTLTTSLVHPREVFKPAITYGSAGIVIFHNHPSNDPTPSDEDMEITERLVDAGDIIGIPVIDHIVFCSDGSGYRSFRELDLLPETN